ncbi:Protease Do-like 1, chloroplastic [Symbiodinium microadriaticum]|uniref:Protease Do-like 1, chloroplastic n=1 Tax=Symbiodinium microadriaticum TaxID=2951 RepID=A0A1Q9EFW3_SYMMI|nr:Protease Do-like 1, chloroplastic [Symbiodinium microadriaticum]
MYLVCQDSHARSLNLPNCGSSPWQRVATFASALVLTAVLTLQGSLPTPLPAQAFEELSSGEVQTVDLFQRNTPGVVYITKEVFKFANAGKMMEIQMVPEGSGTGWVYDLEGHIVTNYHVIENAQAVTVKFIEGTEVLAKVVGADPYSDVAVLQVDLSKTKKEMLRPLSRGSSANLRVGQEVLAIGNPFGLDHTLTKGIVSGVGRTIQSVGGRPIQGAIQTDASINPGNSGGPLLNSRGQVIGMNTAIFSPSGASAGVGFAIPSDTVAARVASILKFGYVKRPSLGLYLGQDGLAQRLSGRPGGLISGLQRSSAAAEAGLKPGDIVLKIDERNISTVNDIFAVLDEHQPGDVIKVRFLRPDRPESLGSSSGLACFHFFCQSAGYAMQEKLFAADGTGKKSLDCRKHRRRKRKRACTGEVMAAKVGGAVASKLSSEAGAVSNGTDTMLKVLARHLLGETAAIVVPEPLILVLGYVPMVRVGSDLDVAVIEATPKESKQKDTVDRKKALACLRQLAAALQEAKLPDIRIALRIFSAKVPHGEAMGETAAAYEYFKRNPLALREGDILMISALFQDEPLSMVTGTKPSPANPEKCCPQPLGLQPMATEEELMQDHDLARLLLAFFNWAAEDLPRLQSFTLSVSSAKAERRAGPFKPLILAVPFAPGENAARCLRADVWEMLIRRELQRASRFMKQAVSQNGPDRRDAWPSRERENVRKLSKLSMAQ